MKINKFGALLVFGAILIAPHAEAQVQVLTGGIGEGGIAAMEQQQNAYSFKAVFSGNGGIFLSSVNAEIVDRQNNEIVNVTTEGPVLLATLPPGRYTMIASIGGQYEKRVNFTVGRRGLKTLELRLPVSDNTYTAPQADMGRYPNGRAVKGAEPYYDPDYQARGYYPNTTTTTVTYEDRARVYYPNSYYETHTDWDVQSRGHDSGFPDGGMQRDEYAPPGMAVEGTHAARGKDQQQP